MAISKKRAPRVPSDVFVNRVIDKIYDDINELINAVNQGETTVEKLSELGKPGDIRIVKDADGAYFIEAYTDEGWIQSTNTTASGYKFKDK
jgi:translation initiation factor IF-2|tara:strand:- start:35249 stop:35521 length:273 start_codon:yes stop_codon:yes gene_type:complete